jgi:hypothetical protein
MRLETNEPFRVYTPSSVTIHAISSPWNFWRGTYHYFALELTNPGTSDLFEHPYFAILSYDDLTIQVQVVAYYFGKMQVGLVD